jgi:protein-disulfide isomerase
VLIAVGAAVVVAAGVGTVLALIGDDATLETGSTLPHAAEASAVFEGVPQNGVALGRPDAPVTLLEFVDLQCPFCRDFALQALPALIVKHVREGRLRIELRGLAFLGSDSERGLRAAFAASQQDRMFEFVELLYYNQGAENSGWLSDELIEVAADSVPGLDAARLQSDMDSGGVSDLVEEHAADAERRRVTGTPGIFVGPTGGELSRVTLTSVTDVAAIDEAIAAAS